MNWIKRLFLGLLIIAGIFLPLKYLLNSFFRTNDDRPSEIVDFKPISMIVNGGGPFFYAVDNQFFYSNDGDIDFNSKAIWSGEIDDGYFHDFQVSPDNQYITFVEGKEKMIVLRKDGKIMTKISPVSETTVEEDRRSGNFIGENFQWSADSKKLFLLCDKKWEGDRSSENTSSIFEYSISANKFTEFINLKEECSGSFFFDLSHQYVYYQVTIAGSFYIKRIRIDNPEDFKIYNTSGIQIEDIAKDSVFIDYTNEQFGNWDSKGINLFRSDGDYFYLYTPDSTNKKVFKTKWGVNAFKGTGYDFQNGKSGFLPNDKFYYTGSWAKDFEGTIFIDVETLHYTFVEKDFRCYYSKTNLDYPDFVLRYEIEPDLEFETSH